MYDRYYIIPVFVPHRGCPHDCIFCNQKKITGSISDISYEDVVSIIDTYLKTINRDNSFIELSFFGGSFTGIPISYQNELLRAANNALREGKIDAVRLSTRPDYINREILDNLLKHGVSVIELGVQSMDEEVLGIAERGHSRDDVIRASGLIREYGIKLGLQMMVGLPGDTLEKDLHTADEIIRLEPDFVRIYPALVIKDTYMEFMFRSGEYIPLSVDEAVEICKKLFFKFTARQIKIIRIGLQPTEQINLGRDVLAGPFHPAFRELVESSVLNDMLRYMIKSFFSSSESIAVDISPRDISKLFSDKKRFFNNKIEEDASKNITIRQNPTMNSFELMLSDGKSNKKMSIIEYINIAN